MAISHANVDGCPKHTGSAYRLLCVADQALIELALTAVGPQYPPQYQQGPEDGAAKGNYAPAPYPAGAYQAQPVPGYAPGHYPAGA